MLNLLLQSCWVCNLCRQHDVPCISTRVCSALGYIPVPAPLILPPFPSPWKFYPVSANDLRLEILVFLVDMVRLTSSTILCMESHYDDVIMTMLPSQITSLTVVYSIVYSGANQRKHQSSASLAFVREIHRGPVNFPHKWPVTRKMFPFDDVIMCKIPRSPSIFSCDLSYTDFMFSSSVFSESPMIPSRTSKQ